MDTNFSFDLPKNKSNVMKVMGVGGGGSNAVNYMYSQGIKGVDFIVCNTDSQAVSYTHLRAHETREDGVVRGGVVKKR